MTTRDEWRWTDDRGVQRLVGTDELRAALASALLPASTLVWRDGMKEWAAASTMAELADAVAQAPKGQTAKGRASLVGVLEQINEEAHAHSSAHSSVNSSVDLGASASTGAPPRVKPVPAGPLALPSAPSKRPRAPGLPSRTAMRTLTGMTSPDAQKIAPQAAPIAVPSPSVMRAAITQIPQQGTSPARFDALEIPKAPGLPQTLSSPRAAPQRKMTSREIDGEWSSPSADLADEDATQPHLARPTREDPDKGSKREAEKAEEARPAADRSIAAIKPVPRAAPKLTAPTITAPAKVPAPAPRPVLHRPPVATRPASKMPPAMPGAKPFVFPPAPLPAGMVAPATTSNARSMSDPDTAELPESASPTAESLETLASALPPVTEGPPLDVTPLSPGVHPSYAARSSHSEPPPGAARISSPPPIPRGVTITTTALIPHPAPLPREASAELPPPRAPQPSYSQHTEAPRTPLASRPPPPNIEPMPVVTPEPSAVSAAAPELLRPPPSAAPRSAPVTSQRAPLPASQRASASSRAREAQPLDGPVAVPVGSLYGAGGALICMVVTAFFAGRCSAQAPPQIARASLAAVPALARAAIPPPPKACWVTRQPVMWAPKASKSIPFEVAATTEGALAIGYARDANEAMGIVVSPATGEVKSAFSKKSEEDIDRVTPSSAAEFHLVTAAKEGAIGSIIPVAATPPFVIGVQGGSIVIADREGAASSPLWPLAGSEAPSAARVQIAEGQGFALVYRREGAIWSGWLGPDRKPVGELVKVAGSGGSVGKPNIGWNHRELALIFADKPAGSDHYEIRVAHAPTGSIPAVTSVIPLPKGGPGGDAFAPDIAGLPDGRWVMVWTEGAAGSRAIRAQTLTHDFTPLGDPIALSPPAGNFGQGVLGVTNGYAAAVFLSKGASSYELWGSVLQCG